MSNTTAVEVPDFLLKKVRELAEKEGFSVDQFVSSAVAEKTSAWLTLDYLKKRGQRASREKFEAVLAKVPEAEPDEWDRLD